MAWGYERRESCQSDTNGFVYLALVFVKAVKTSQDINEGSAWLLRRAAALFVPSSCEIAILYSTQLVHPTVLLVITSISLQLFLWDAV